MVSRTTFLNMVPSSVRPVVYVSQYDVDTECLFFYLYNGSDIFNIPDGMVVSITGAKPDNTLFAYNCTYSGNKVTANLEEQMTLVKGDVTCEISIQNYSTGQTIGSANFVMRVEESPYYKATMSKTDIDNLHDIIKAATEEATNRAETSASSANTSALEASASASAAKASATEAANTASEFKSDVIEIKDEFEQEAARLAQEYAEAASKESESWAVGGTGTRTSEDMDNSKYYSELSKTHSLDAANSAQLAKDYSTIVMPDLILDTDSGILYEKTGVGIDVKMDDDTAEIYWKITVGG